MFATLRLPMLLILGVTAGQLLTGCTGTTTTSSSTATSSSSSQPSDTNSSSISSAMASSSSSAPIVAKAFTVEVTQVDVRTMDQGAVVAVTGLPLVSPELVASDAQQGEAAQ